MIRIVGYEKFKNDVTQWFKECPDVYHTTLIDLYGLSTDFPVYTTTRHLQPYNRIAAMEQQLKEDLQFYRFIPFIQLHEFEALLFSNTTEMEHWLSLYNKLPAGCFTQILQAAPDANAGLINEGVETAPSKRIIALCDAGYDKINDGLLVLKQIGLKNIRAACKHFDEWLSTLEKLA